MKYHTIRIVPGIFLFLMLTCCAVAQDPIEVYIDQYKDIAIQEMDRTGIPASIKLAQAILESDAGRSNLATKAKNHFGIKCGYDWKGPTFKKKDDDRDRRGKLIKSCFRSYKDPRSSFIDHSEFLLDPNKEHRYGPLFEIPKKQYKKWAKGLKKSGYATNPKYDKLLIDLIERYALYKFDKEDYFSKVTEEEPIVIDLEDDEDDPLIVEDEEPGAYLYNNDVRYILGKEWREHR